MLIGYIIKFMINNIKLIDINKNYDERGFFAEILRLSDHKFNFSKAQISHSRVKKNIIKGWHGHKKQFQWNYVVCGAIELVLYDNNPRSLTYKKSLKTLIDNKKNNYAYFFGPGILHSYKCISNHIDIIYVTSNSYDPKNEIKINLYDSKILFNW